MPDTPATSSILEPGEKPWRHETMMRVIIESPCRASDTGSFDTHREYALRCLRDSISKNEAPLASHVLLAFSGALDDNIDEQRIMGTAAGWAWIERADKLLVYGDYGISQGMQTAMSLAGLHGIPTSHRLIGKNEAPTS